jgi:1-deoxy-D-xylulose-5-phosphate reductoisomerase
MNAANEIAVAAFLDREIRFPEIWRIVEQVMNRHPPVAHPDLDAILRADQWARAQAQGSVQSVER